jgi:hypothetical protein
VEDDEEEGEDQAEDEVGELRGREVGDAIMVGLIWKDRHGDERSVESVYSYGFWWAVEIGHE